MKPNVLIGPEVLWLVLVVLAKYFGKRNKANEGKYNHSFERMVTLIPLLLFCFGVMLYLIPAISKNYMAARIIISAIVGSHFFYTSLAASHTTGGPGAGMIYIAGIIVTVISAMGILLVKALFIS